jgi:uncharacterized tellurite resistance protein B-like protein
MRTYPRNSPEAAARIVGLVLIADGHVCGSEDKALEKIDLTCELGLKPGEFRRIVQTLCEDYLLGTISVAQEPVPVPELVLADLMAEIDEPSLQRAVFRVCMEVVNADGHLADGEMTVLSAVLKHWPVAAQHELCPLPA